MGRSKKVKDVVIPNTPQEIIDANVQPFAPEEYVCWNTEKLNVDALHKSCVYTINDMYKEKFNNLGKEIVEKCKRIGIDAHIDIKITYENIK